MKPYLLGGGGHARSILTAARAGNFAGYFAPRAEPGFPIPYCGTDADALKLADDSCFLCAIGDAGMEAQGLSLRRRILEKFSSRRFCTVVAADAFVAETAKVGEGTAVLHKAVVNDGTILGAHCTVNNGAIVEHDCWIGFNVQIAPGAVVAGGVTIGDNTIVSMGALVRENVTICTGALIGMGAVVVGDIAVPGIYCGIPAKITRRF